MSASFLHSSIEQYTVFIPEIFFLLQNRTVVVVSIFVRNMVAADLLLLLVF